MYIYIYICISLFLFWNIKAEGLRFSRPWVCRVWLLVASFDHSGGARNVVADIVLDQKSTFGAPRGDFCSSVHAKESGTKGVRKCDSQTSGRGPRKYSQTLGEPPNLTETSGRGPRKYSQTLGEPPNLAETSGGIKQTSMKPARGIRETNGAEWSGA
jgi:hypothetical protein